MGHGGGGGHGGHGGGGGHHGHSGFLLAGPSWWGGAVYDVIDPEDFGIPDATIPGTVAMHVPDDGVPFDGSYFEDPAPTIIVAPVARRGYRLLG